MKIRRILALMLVLAFAACLFAGCSNDKNTPSDDPSTSAPNSSSDSAPVSGDVENKRVVLLVKQLSSSYWTDLADAVQKQCDEYGWKLDVLCLYGQSLPLVPFRPFQPLVSLLWSGTLLAYSHFRRTGQTLQDAQGNH